MRKSYAVMVTDEKAVRAWFEKVDLRLRMGRGVLIRGAARHIGKDLYAVSIETAIGTLTLTFAPLMIMVCGVVAGVIFHAPIIASILCVIGGVGVAAVYALMMPGVHRLVMMLTLRRVAGHWVRVSPATGEAMRKLAYGTK